MTYKTVLCVGIYDNGLSLLLKLLLKKKPVVKFVKSSGVNDLAHNELSPSKSVIKIALDLGFVLVQYDPAHPKTIKDAKAKNHTVIHHRPKHISAIKDLTVFDLIVTPYRSVHDQLLERRGIDPKKIALINHPTGVDLRIRFEESYPILRSWVDQNF